MQTSSRERWRSAPAMIALREEILRAYHEAGAVTDASLERIPRFVRRRFAYSTLRTQRGELVKLGLVRKCGMTRDMNRDGRLTRMAIWELSERGRFLDPRMLPRYEQRIRRRQTLLGGPRSTSVRQQRCA